MDLTNFKKIDNTVKTTMILTFVVCLTMATAFVISFFYLSSKVDAAYTKALVLDPSGNVYSVTAVQSVDMRKYEYENHVKLFIQKWYAFDENNYEKNIMQALNWIGERGKEMVNEYNDVGMLNSLIQKSIYYKVAIKEIKVNISTVPVSGEILFTQIGFRARGSVARDIYVNFTLYDISRSSDNPHGVKIDDWIVRYGEPRETTIEEEKTKNYNDGN